MSRLFDLLLTASAALLFASGALAQAAGDPPPVERCVQLCAQYYSADTEKREQCDTGCKDAESCIANCATRFADDESKRASCAARCAR